MKFNWKITTREEFMHMLKLLYVKGLLAVLGVALACLAIGYPAKLMLGEENALSYAVAMILFVVIMAWGATVIVFGAYSLYRAMHAMYKAKQAFDAGNDEEVAAYKLQIHYSLPFAFPVGIGGFTPFGIVLAFALAYMIYKWGLPLYKWSDVKKALFHKDGTTWKCTLLTWANFYFFFMASFYIVFVVSIIVAIIYLLFKLGVAQAAWEGLTNLVSNTMANAGSSSRYNSCHDCAYYNIMGDSACGHGHSNPAGLCPYFKRG